MKKNANLKIINLESNTSNVNKPLIFNKKINKSKVIGLNPIMGNVGPTRHFTPAAQEWFNSVYSFNKNYIKLLPTADKNLMKLVRSYFNLYIKNFLTYEENKSKNLPTRYRRLSVKRIFVGKGDLKHTSTKVIITLYVYNYEKRRFLVKEVKEITNWLKNKPMSNYSRPLVTRIVKDNVFLSYKKWFNWNSYSLLNKDSSLILERFYLNKFFDGFSLNISSLNETIPRARLVKENNPLYADFILNNKEPLTIFKPLYYDYCKFISSLSINENKKPSLENFLNLIRIVSTESLNNLNNNNVDLNNKVLYLNYIKGFLSKFFVINRKLTRISINLNKLTSLNNSVIKNEFSERILNYRFIMFKSKIYSCDGKNKKVMKIMKVLTFDRYLSLLRNINIKNLVKLNSRKDITLYLYHVNNYLSKFFFVKKNIIFNIIDSLKNFKNQDIDFSNNSLYLDYYKYLISGKFIGENNPSFDEFLSLIQSIEINNFKNLKEKYETLNNNKTMYLKDKENSIDLNNMNNLVFNLDLKDLSQQAIYLKKQTFVQYLKVKFITLQTLIFNQNKFKISFLRYLTRLVSNLYNKKVVFNIVNLKKLHLNSDIYTQAVSLKLKNRKNRLYGVLKKSLRKVDIPYVNKMKEKFNDVNLEQLVANKVKNIKVNSMLSNFITNKDPLNKLLLNIFSAPARHNTSLESLDSQYWDSQWEEKQNSEDDKEYLVLNSLKHIGLTGVRIEAKGRLTRRFTASRSVFKMKWKGSLKNVDSSLKGLSTPMLRGHAKSNLQYTVINSKNRNGAFGVKGWVSSK